MKVRKYRIVKTKFGHYQCQSWALLFPFWINIGNQRSCLEQALDYIENKKQVVWESEFARKKNKTKIKKMNFIDELKEYLNSTTKEQVLKDWEKSLIECDVPFNIMDLINKSESISDVVAGLCEHNWHHIDNHSDRMECVKCNKHI
jgi:signal recognition particle GTPase